MLLKMAVVKRFKCICAYDGTSLIGWQSQASGKGIQDVIQQVLAKIFSEKIMIHGSGRTDAGVHAVGQVFHFDACWSHSLEALLKAINSLLPESIQLTSVREVDLAFHARFSVKKKRYSYYLHLGYALPTKRLYAWSLGRHSYDVDLMKQAAEMFLGEHDFALFTPAAQRKQKQTTVREIYRSDLVVQGASLKYVTEGNGYLYKMVRKMVGAIVGVGKGNLELSELKEVLDQKNQGVRIYTAPAQGLFLEKVWY